MQSKKYQPLNSRSSALVSKKDTELAVGSFEVKNDANVSRSSEPNMNATQDLMQ
jgi:hypothetical protein